MCAAGSCRPGAQRSVALKAVGAMLRGSSRGTLSTRCSANILVAADHILHRFQEGSLWPMLVAESLVATVGNGLAFCLSTWEEPMAPIWGPSPAGHQ